MNLHGDVVQHTVTYYADQVHNALGAHRERGAQSYRTLNGAHDKMCAKVWHMITSVQLMGGSGKLQRRTQIFSPAATEAHPRTPEGTANNEPETNLQSAKFRVALMVAQTRQSPHRGFNHLLGTESILPSSWTICRASRYENFAGAMAASCSKGESCA